jgi:hypothetical protein
MRTLTQLRLWGEELRQAVERIVPAEDREEFARHMIGKLENSVAHAYKTWKFNQTAKRG